MATKGKASEVGETKPTENTEKTMDALVDDVLGSPDAGLDKKEDGLNEEVEKAEEQASEDIENQAEEPETEQGEADGEEADPENAADPQDDDVVPASKHKKVLDKMQKRIDQLVAERESIKAKEQASAKTQDEKLAHLTIQELGQLRDNVEDSILDAKVAAKVEGTDTAARVNELKELKDSIDQAVKAAPQRFAQKQMTYLTDMAESVKEIDPEVVNQQGELWETAKAVYQSMPSLQRSETGQAEALALAAQYYVEKKDLQGGREKASTLSRQVTNMKRKTSLDRKVSTANADKIAASKLKDKAKNGTYYDKLAFIHDTLVPDEFLKPQ